MENNRLLLDTSYLLPIFGLRLEYRDFESFFPRLQERYVVRYNPASLIEAKWIILKQAKKFPDQREPLLQSYKKGLLSLQRDEGIQSTDILTNEEIEELSDSLLMHNKIPDYFDRLIYSTAAQMHCALLTEDSRLHELFDENKGRSLQQQPKELLTWREMSLLF